MSSGTGHLFELAFMVDDDAAVDRLYATWRAAGMPIEQQPTVAVFGRTFVALDPDGHRLRVCTLDEYVPSRFSGCDGGNIQRQ